MRNPIVVFMMIATMIMTLVAMPAMSLAVSDTEANLEEDGTAEGAPEQDTEEGASLQPAFQDEDSGEDLEETETDDDSGQEIRTPEEGLEYNSVSD